MSMGTRPTLDELALRYGTGKSSQVHNYCPIYERYLAPLRDQPIRLLEIGVAEGHSLRMWREYFPQAVIFGLDPDPPGAIPGCQIFQGMQEDIAFLQQVSDTAGPFDVIIDDASHMGFLTLISFQTLWPRLTEHGLYIVEDTNTGWQPRFGPVNFLANAPLWIAAIHYGGRSDHGDPATLDAPRYNALLARLEGYERDMAALHVHPLMVVIEKDAGRIGPRR